MDDEGIYCLTVSDDFIFEINTKKTTHHMLLPGLLGPGLLQLLQVPQLGVQLVHPVGLGLVGHVVLLQQLAGGLAGAESLHHLNRFNEISVLRALDINC